MIVFKGHRDTLMVSKTFQQMAHLHSLLILRPESFPLEGTGQNDFVWKDKKLQLRTDLISCTENKTVKNDLLFPHQTK